jgi:plastocyanin domain-containing protein
VFKTAVRATLFASLLAVFAGGDGGESGTTFEKGLAPIPEDARRIPIEVRNTGYVPDKLAAEAGEDLVLAFTRVDDIECGRYVKVQGTDIRAELPLNQTVEIRVKMPVTGELVFSCGMDMMRGVLSVGSRPKKDGA